MTWSIATPFLLFIPFLICIVVFVFLSAGFLLSIRQGFLRLLVYIISCFFMLAFFLVFNHSLILATTKVQIDFPTRYLKYENYYGAVRIPAEKIQALAMRDGSESSGVWVQYEGQILHLDQRFTRLNEFFPLLQSIVKFDTPEPKSGYIVYRANDYTNKLNLNSNFIGNNPLRNLTTGGIQYFFPWLGVFSIAAFPLAARAWQGKIRYFQILGLCYYLPTLIICLFTKPGLPLAVFLLIYPGYVIYLSAMDG